MPNLYYYDREIAVCEKPRGVLSEGTGEGTMPTLLARTLADEGVRGPVYPVHRLDRGTEGIMVFALTKEAAAALSAQMADRRATKEYVAEVCGVPSPAEGRMEDLLYFDRGRNRSYVVTRERRGVKRAALRYRVLGSENGISRVAVQLETGRTHQIRVQFASRKMPLVGDRAYGAPPCEQPMALRACYLAFDHPRTGERMAFGESQFPS